MRIIRSIRRFWKKGYRVVSPFLLALTLSLCFILHDKWLEDSTPDFISLLLMTVIGFTAVGTVFFLFMGADDY